MEIDLLVFGHIGPSYKNFGQDQAIDPLYHNIRKEVIAVNKVLVEGKKSKAQGCTLW